MNLAFLFAASPHGWGIVGVAAAAAVPVGFLAFLLFSGGVPWRASKRVSVWTPVDIDGEWPEMALWLKEMPENTYDPALDDRDPHEYTPDFYPGTDYGYYHNMGYVAHQGTWGYRDLQGRFQRALLHDQFKFPELVNKYAPAESCTS